MCCSANESDLPHKTFVSPLPRLNCCLVLQLSTCSTSCSTVCDTAEALSSLLRNEPWIKPLVLEPLKASLTQRPRYRYLQDVHAKEQMILHPLPPNFNVGQQQKDSCKGNDLRRKLIARSWNL